jgi:hypothetical protein
MTVEVGILNKQSVALAADSAVTTGINGKQKVYNSANKLFMLSATAPIGIMIYGSATHMGIPWETIIKLYRKQLSNITYSSTKEYAVNFIGFISNEITIHDIAMEKFLNTHAYNLIDEIIRTTYNEKEATTDADILNKIDDLSKIIDTEYTIPPTLREVTLNNYKESVLTTFKNYCNANNITQLETITLERMFTLFIKYSTCTYMTNTSGIVIAGFGEDEYFPSLFSYLVKGSIEQTLIYSSMEEVIISDENEATIVPFAQTGMIKTFLQGVNPELFTHSKKELDSTIRSLLVGIKDIVVKANSQIDEIELEKNLTELGEEVIYEYVKKLDEYRHKNHIMPIIDTVQMLGKEDLAAMAENLVSITSMEKKMSMDIESVGGPIDVAVISKGDGFIWYKRKHYFDITYNQHFKNDRSL